MNKSIILPVILAGGTGSRLWPMSRALHPKQFLPLYGEKTMLQQAVLRLTEIELTNDQFAKPVIVCNQQHRFLVAEQMREIEQACDIILEPEEKNTAPAITLATLKTVGQGEDSLILVLTADHIIQNINALTESIELAIDLALTHKIVTFGVVTQSAQTGYGYIKKGKMISGGYEVEQFIEKPNLEKAELFHQSECYFWNSGMFVFQASCYLTELEKYCPEIYQVCQRSLQAATKDLDFIRIDTSLFADCPAQSIDYAVMENTHLAVMVSMDAGWSDIGSWAAIWELAEKDKNNNYLHGNIVADESSDCLVYAEERLVSILGLNNIVVVDTKDAVLIAEKNSVQDVKRMVELLKSNNKKQWQTHREVFRPWGKFDVIDIEKQYQVKRITVNPSAKISLQTHQYRSEHWIVVVGTAKVRKGNRTFEVKENESTYIPIGEIHSLENPGKTPLELIEVQTGSYLGEDDIVRLEDNYGRI